jgi:hypothetical protein
MLPETILSTSAFDTQHSALIYHTGHLGLLDTDRAAIALFERAGYPVYVLDMPPAPHDGLPVRTFLDPTIALVNRLEAAGVEWIIMVGLSGGGWTTTLAAAIDPRIDASYPVAGSIPLDMRWREADIGDYEQTLPALYEIASYEMLYALGASGGRRQLQIRNVYDDCCFTGEDVSYKDAVQVLSPTFDVWLDTSHHEHKTSEWAVRIILGDLQLLRGH